MNIVVQKFGGTSVSTTEARNHCIAHIKRELTNQNKVVVVVSAMGRKGDPYATDTLLSLLDSERTSKRELDLFLSTGETISASVFSNLLTSEGIPNTVLTGGQAGIVTNENFTNANIISLQPKRLLEELNRFDVVVVTGFQGMTANGEITTLGRGGSDTSATALGVALNASVVDIFTDVEGIYTADPRIVEEAKALPSITYNETCNLAHLGAKVIHPRAVEMAMQKNIPIRVRSTFSSNEGTLISNINEIDRSHHDIKERLITGITQTPNISQFKIENETKDFYFQLNIFNAMKTAEISVDLINVSQENVIFTVSNEDKEKTKSLIEELGYTPLINPSCAKVSLVGANMEGVPGVMAQIIEALTTNQIPIYQTADSHTTIWVLVNNDQMKEAICTLHKQFKLHESW